MTETTALSAQNAVIQCGNSPQTTYALFHNGKMVSKEHSTFGAAVQEAFDLRVVVQDKFSKTLADGYEVKRV